MIPCLVSLCLLGLGTVCQGAVPPPAGGKPSTPDPQIDGFCQVTSHVTGNHFDLSELMRTPPGDTSDWLIRGNDFPANFSANICAPLITPVKVKDVKAPQNVSASYKDPVTGEIKSLGSVSSAPFTRGRSLLLEYTDGSPCVGPKGEKTPYRMSSLFSFKCDSNAHKRAIISYVASPNNCSFYFEVRTPYACPAVNENESLNPFIIFLVITFVAFLVYVVGTSLWSPRGGVSLGGIRLTTASFGRRTSGGSKYDYDI